MRSLRQGKLYLKMAGATRPKRRALGNWLLVLWEKEQENFLWKQGNKKGNFFKVARRVMNKSSDLFHFVQLIRSENFSTVEFR